MRRIGFRLLVSPWLVCIYVHHSFATSSYACLPLAPFLQALCKGLSDASPLFRHEVAYVLGQLAHPASAESLKARVLDAAEHDMVRHEAAEALGAIGDEASVEFLQKYTADGTVMLRESCVVALDAADYWSAAGEGLDAAAAAPAGEAAPAAAVASA